MVITLSGRDANDVTRVLSAAFARYPVMRHVLGNPPDYAERLPTLVGLFVAARVLRDDLLLGIRGPGGELTAAAMVTLPADRDPPPALDTVREATWGRLGSEARARYEAFGAATRAFQVAERHHHLNMIGVLPSQAGRGFGRALLEHVHAFAAEDAESAGVSLTTELRSNVSLYEHFGYRCVGHAVVPPALETWGMFRPRDAGTAVGGRSG